MNIRILNWDAAKGKSSMKGKGGQGTTCSFFHIGEQASPSLMCVFENGIERERGREPCLGRRSPERVKRKVKFHMHATHF